MLLVGNYKVASDYPSVLAGHHQGSVSQNVPMSGCDRGNRQLALITASPIKARDVSTGVPLGDVSGNI
jgi:hypothetical protein